MAITIGQISSAYNQSVNPLPSSHDNDTNNFLVGGGFVFFPSGAHLLSADYNSVAMTEIGATYEVSNVLSIAWYYLNDPASEINTLELNQETSPISTDDMVWGISFNGEGLKAIGEDLEHHSTTGTGFDYNYQTTFANSILIAFVFRSENNSISETSGEGWIEQITGISGDTLGNVYTLQTGAIGVYNFNTTSGGAAASEVLRIVEIAEIPADIEFLDTFSEDAPITNILSHNLDIPSTAGWTDPVHRDFLIDDVQDYAYVDNTGGAGAYLNRVDTAFANLIQSAEATITFQKAGNSTGSIAGIGVRDSGSRGVYAYLRTSSDPAFNRVYLVLRNSSNFEDATNVVTGWALGVPHNLRMEVENETGTTFRVKIYVDDVLHINETRSQSNIFNNEGAPAIYADTDDVASGDRLIIDNLKAWSEPGVQPKAFTDSAAALPGSSAWALAKTKSFADPGPEGAELYNVIAPVHKAFSDAGVGGSEFFEIQKLLSFFDAGPEGVEAFSLIKARSFSDAGPEGVETYSKTAFQFPTYLKERVEAIIIKIMDD